MTEPSKEEIEEIAAAMQELEDVLDDMNDVLGD